eukprot:scaffold66386_cov19-Tisochrysis_lutea.AAC.1
MISPTMSSTAPSHGAFCLLADWEARAFRGGETVIAKPRLLDYWSTHNPNEGLEHDALFTMVPPEFGRLTVFVSAAFLDLNLCMSLANHVGQQLLHQKPLEH